MDILGEIKDIMRAQEEERKSAEKEADKKKAAEIDELIKRVTKKKPETPFDKIRKRHDG